MVGRASSKVDFFVGNAALRIILSESTILMLVGVVFASRMRKLLIIHSFLERWILNCGA